MGKARHLSRAPLREALIDLQFETPVALDTIRAFAAAKAKQFEQVGDIWQASVGFNLGQDGGVGTSAGSIALGKRLDSKAPPHVLQIKTTGFTFSRLHPYDTWQSMRDAAAALWRDFAEVAKPSVSRTALRYINELKLPLPITDFADYLTVPPQVPAALPQSISGFLQRTVIVNQPSGSVAVVMQAMEDIQAGLSPQDVTVVLDIDVFRYEQVQPLGDRLTQSLEDLHEFKNRIFFEHLTDRALELYA